MDEIEPPRTLMMEGIDSSIDSLMEEHVVEIVGSAFKINIAKPHGTTDDDGEPCAPAPHLEPQSPCVANECPHEGYEQRDEDAEWPFGEESQEQKDAEAPAVRSFFLT